MIFQGINFNSLDKSTTAFAMSELEHYIRRKDTFCWIDLQSNDITDLYELLSKFDNDLALDSHFEEPEVLPRIMERKDSLVFFLYEIIDPESHLDTTHELKPIKLSRMVMILSKHYIITFHYESIEAVQHIQGIAEENFKLAGETPGFIVFLFLQRCLYDCAHLNLANDNYLDKLEIGVLSGKPRELERKISTCGLNILTLKKMSTNLHIILMLLSTKLNPFVSNDARNSFRDIMQNAIATRAAIDSSRILLDSVIASVQANASSRTREIARVLTVVSSIFLPLTLIAGIYGMNFNLIPGKNAEWGFLITVGFMLILLCIMLLVFHSIGWIGQSSKRK